MRSLQRFVLASLILVFVSGTIAQERVPKIPGIDTSGMDLSVRPQDDFFRYVNGKWVGDTDIPADQSSFGTFAMLRLEAQEAVRAIIEEQARTKAAPGSLAQKVGDYYKAYMDTARRDSLGIAPLKSEIDDIAKIKTAKDLARGFARASQIGVRLPFNVNVGTDQRNSSAYAVSVSQSGLGMPDRDYYLRTDGKFPDTRKAYTTYIARVFALSNQPDPEGAAARIVDLETKIAKLQWDRARNRDRNATYNKMPVTALQSSTPHFDWQAYLAELPADAKSKVKEVIVRQPDYIASIDAVITETPIETWKE